jgi:hypothetical protein
MPDQKKLEFIESYIKTSLGDYKWNGNNGELIRCRDCKYAHKTYDGDCKYCDMFTDDDGNPIERYCSGDWYCADGVKKDE